MSGQLIIPAGFCQVTMRFALAGDAGETLSSLGMAVTSEPNVDDVNDLVVGFSGAIAELVGGNATIPDAKVIVGAAEPPYEILEFPVTGAGFGNTACCPPAVAALLHKTTGFGGRRNKGRNYIPFVKETIIDSTGTWASVSVGIANAALQDWLNDEATVGPWAGLVILHTNQPSVLAPTPVTSFFLDPKVATQRRRQDR